MYSVQTFYRLPELYNLPSRAAPQPWKSNKQFKINMSETTLAFSAKQTPTDFPLNQSMPASFFWLFQP